MKIVAISDIHGKWNKLIIPECDLLISSGDYSFRGEKHIVRDFHKWLNKQPAKHIISVQGNHEVWVEQNFEEAKQIALEECPKVHFVDEGLVEVEDVKLWCSAVTPWFHDWAWNRFRGEQIRQHWDKIPEDTNIIVTHGPPYGILDRVPNGTNAGCQDLLDKVIQTKAGLHIFGHIHCGRGYKYLHNKLFVNAASVDESYKVVTMPIYVIKRHSDGKYYVEEE